MKVLIIYELIPEETYCYTVDVQDTDELKKLKSCHGQYINLEDMDDDLTTWLTEWTTNHKDERISIEIRNGVIPIADCEILIHTGFML